MSHTVVGLNDGEFKNTAGSGQGRVKRRRIQPYAWLGAGAVTLGLGVAMVGGAATACADSDGGSSATSSASGSSDSTVGAATKSESAARVTSRGHSARKSIASSPGANNNRRESVIQKPDVDTASETLPASSAAAAETDGGESAATEAAAPTKPTGASSARIDTAAAIETTPAAAASTPSPAADPSFSMTSWVDPTTPGAHVELAKQQIADARAALNQTWASGNILAGLASLAPSIILSQASLSLDLWGTFTPITQQMVAGTMNIPIIHQAAQISLLSSLAIPSFAIAQMNLAAMLIPLVGLFGGSAAASEASGLVSSAKENGRVYGLVPLTMKANTQPIVYITLDNGARVPVLVDTGASGLVLSPTAVGTNFGTPIGSGSSGFSGGLSYDYTTYNAVVDFGNGITTTPTAVNIVNPEDAAAFDAYFAPSYVVGVLGIGANAAGPGPSIPNAALPGELGNGVLVYQDLGVLVFGLNPLPGWASIPGAPNANLLAKVGNNPVSAAYAIIDSGGVYGTMPKYINGNSNSIPSGTKISVYTNDGQTLLYSYTTKGVNSPTVVPDNGLMNTGNEPFAQYPIYIDYSPSNGIGATVFSWF